MSSVDITPAAATIEEAKVEQLATVIEYKADLIYGPSDSGKTTNIGYASDYVLRKYGKLSRLVTADGGGGVPGLDGSGQLETWAIGAWKEQLGSDSKSIVLKAMQRAVEGYWPARLDDPESVLLAPDAGTWEIYGLGAFEGLTSWGDNVLMNLKSEQASLSQDPSYVHIQGGVKFSGGNRSYYGFVQDQIFAWVALSHLLPYAKVVWTALESRGDDQDGQPIYGPAIAGKKSIGKASQWFKNTLHIDIINKPSVEAKLADGKTVVIVTETERIMWLRTHADNMSKINFPAKIRVPVAYKSEVPAYLIPPNIATVYELIDKLEAKQIADSRGKMAEIEGVRERLLKAAAAAKVRQEKAAVEKAKRAGSMPSFSLPSFTTSKPAASVVVPVSAATRDGSSAAGASATGLTQAEVSIGAATVGKSEPGEQAAAAPLATTPSSAAPITPPTVIPGTVIPGSVPVIQTMRRK